MMTKLPLYISAISLFIAVVGTIFLFNQIQKLRKSLALLSKDRNLTNQLDNKIDVVTDKLATLSDKVFKLERIEKKVIPDVPPPVNEVNEDNEDIEVESVGSRD